MRLLRFPSVLLIALATLSIHSLSVAAAQAEETFTFEFEAEAMEIPDTHPMWAAVPRAGNSNGIWMVPLKQEGDSPQNPAVYALTLPLAGTWYVWARHAVHPTRSKAFAIRIQGLELPFGTLPFGETPEEKPEVYGDREPEGGNSRLVWSRQDLELPKGPVDVELMNKVFEPQEAIFRGQRVIGQSPAVDLIVITNDPNFEPL